MKEGLDFTHYRPARTDLAGMTKAEQREKLAADVDAFLADGGEIEQVPFLKTTYHYNQNVYDYVRIQIFGDRWGVGPAGDTAEELMKQALTTLRNAEVGDA